MTWIDLFSYVNNLYCDFFVSFMDKYTLTNLRKWDELTQINFDSPMYNVERFIESKNSLKSVELSEIGDISGKRILHLQCHFGMDSISLITLGASQVVGIDFSPAAINKAQELRDRVGLAKEHLYFIESDVLKLNQISEDLLEPNSFDLVFTSYGVLGWLNSLIPWAKSIHRYLKNPGVCFILLTCIHSPGFLMMKTRQALR